jgi:hypothetical protein
MTFDNDWWRGGAFDLQIEVAKERCAALKFPECQEFDPEADNEVGTFLRELDTRTVVYLRDGFSYEIKDILDMRSTGFLSFECVPTDDAYKVGAFVVSLPFDEICRVETFAVHASERPDDAPMIKGFSGTPMNPMHRGDMPKARTDGWDMEEDAD